jgi:hypothetical protein
VETAELVQECKKGLGISPESVAFDDLLVQKIKMVKSFMLRAGVPEANLSDDLAVGVIVMGVGDLWESQSGEVKFSPAFNILLSQLTY